MTKRNSLKCVACGRFVKADDPDARHHVVPDTAFGPEINEWTCGPCGRQPDAEPRAALAYEYPP
jgi:rubredoxin